MAAQGSEISKHLIEEIFNLRNIFDVSYLWANSFLILSYRW